MWVYTVVSVESIRSADSAKSWAIREGTIFKMVFSGLAVYATGDVLLPHVCHEGLCAPVDFSGLLVGDQDSSPLHYKVF